MRADFARILFIVKTSVLTIRTTKQKLHIRTEKPIQISTLSCNI